MHPAHLAVLPAANNHAICCSSKDNDPPTPTGTRLPAPGLPLPKHHGGQQEEDTPSPTSPSFLSRLPPPGLMLGEHPDATATSAAVATAPTRPAATLKTTNIIRSSSSSGLAVDVTELVATLESIIASAGPPCESGHSNSSAATASTTAAPSMPAAEALGPLLSVLSRSVIEQADDASLAALLHTLPCLLLRAHGVSKWAAPSLLADLQSACEVSGLLVAVILASI